VSTDLAVETNPGCAGSDKSAARPFMKSILALAILCRLAIVLDVLFRYPHGWLFRSQGELGFLAESLRMGHGLSSPFGGSTGPTAFLAPGYPAVIAFIFSCSAASLRLRPWLSYCCNRRSSY